MLLCIFHHRVIMHTPVENRHIPEYSLLPWKR